MTETNTMRADGSSAPDCSLCIFGEDQTPLAGSPVRCYVTNAVHPADYSCNGVMQITIKHLDSREAAIVAESRRANAHALAEERSDDSVQADVVCDHAFMPCWDKGCKHAVPHKAGQVESLNGLNMGDCADERREHVCCVAAGTPVRIRCVPAHNAEGQGCREARHTLDPLVGQ